MGDEDSPPTATSRSAPAGEAAAADPLFRSHATDVARLCRHLLGPGPAAEDAVHEVFLRARRGFGGYDPRQPFRRWLLAIASHYCIDQLRRRRREARLFDPHEASAPQLVDPAPSPLRHTLAAEQRAVLLAAIDRLPEAYRVPLVLRYFEELDYASIAEALAIGRERVATLLFRARQRLRAELADRRSP